MLILFDIDATLITTSRAGIAAMGNAGREMFGPSFDESRVSFAGRLDPLIMADLLTTHGQPAGPEEVQAFRKAYRRHLVDLLGSNHVARPCLGVPDLLRSLSNREVAMLGLLTGNFPETGRIKLEAAGIDPDLFELQVWGSDSPHDPPTREHLPPVAFAQYERVTGRAVTSSLVTIVGDTPHDVACARAHGCRCLGVATGHFTCEDLERAGADRVVADLSETESIREWLSAPAASAQRSLEL